MLVSIKNIERGLKQVTVSTINGIKKFNVKKEGCGWFTVGSNNRIIYCVGERVSDMEYFIKNMDEDCFYRVTDHKKPAKEIKAKRECAGLYKGTYRGVNFMISKVWEGAFEGWWCVTIDNELMPDYQLTKKAMLEDAKYIIDNPAEFEMNFGSKYKK